jgi:S1-C subfamily serine protease
VVEVDSLGRFMVGYQNLQRMNQPVGKLPEYEVAFPLYLHELELIGGDFDLVETDLVYEAGGDIREVAPDAIPETRIVFGPMLRQRTQTTATTLRTDLENISSGRLTSNQKARVARAVVFIECSYRSGSEKGNTSGSGFVVNPHGYIVTNNHVIEDPAKFSGEEFELVRVEVIRWDGYGFTSPASATIVDRDVDHDLALIKIDGCGLDFLCLQPGNDPSVQEPVVTVGYPGGRSLALTHLPPSPSFRAGQVTSIRYGATSSGNLYEHSAPIEQGNSGGPLLSSTGMVIGVNTYIGGPQNQSRLAVPVSVVKTFLSKQTAEGKGPYDGPNPVEQYVCTMAEVCVVWQQIDGGLFRLGDWTLEPDTWHPPKPPITDAEVIELLTRSIVSLNDLILAMGYLYPEGTFRVPHMQIADGLTTQLEALVEALRIVRNDPEDAFIYADIPGGVRVSDSRERSDRYGDLVINSVQSGRTRIVFAFNRIVGRYWSADAPEGMEYPIRPRVSVSPGTRDGDRFVLNEMANIFLRHRGTRVVIATIEDDRGIEQVVFTDALVSGGKAMMREMQRLAAHLSDGASD